MFIVIQSLAVLKVRANGRGGCKFAKIKKFHFGPPQMVIWVVMSGKTLLVDLYLSKTPPDMPILDFCIPALKVSRLRNINN